MNIFFLNRDPETAAKEHVDKHVVKMIVEYAQLLSTAHRMLDGIEYTDYSKNNRKIKLEWPAFNEEILLEEKINFVVQINGKKRGILKLNRDLNEDKILSEIMKDEILLKYIQNETIKKKIYVPNRLINIII